MVSLTLPRPSISRQSPSWVMASRFVIILILALPLWAARTPLVPRPEGEALRVACVGDSITAGVGAEPGFSYPDQLQLLLGAAWEVGNFGVSGRTLLREGDYPYWKEKAYQQALGFQPDAVVIMLGTNDTKPQNWAKREAFYKDYADLIASFRDLPSHPRIFLCRPIPVVKPGLGGINEECLLEYIAVINRLAADFDLDLIDMHLALRDRARLIPDHVHPDSAGAMEMAKAAYLGLTGTSSRPLSSLTRVSSLFKHHAVLQRDARITVSGIAPDGQGVSVDFAGQHRTTVAEHGRWSVVLSPLEASARPQRMTIQGSDVQSINDLLVGDVWLASGQSNMERQLGPRPPQKPLLGWEEAVAKADYPLIREYYVAHRFTMTPLEDARGRWTVCSPATAAEFSAVGFYFARALQPSAGVPIGIIHASWGGTPAESWMRPEALQPFGDFAAALAEIEARARGKTVAETPATSVPAAAAPVLKINQYSPSVLSNGMLAPLRQTAIRGVIWYQGEANNNRAEQYRSLLPALIRDFRATWGEKLPFLFVQIAPYKDMSPELRDAQLATALSVRNTAMVVTTDVGDADDNHPANKAPVGERLALAARALVYGQSVEYSGPQLKSASFKKGKVLLRFTHAEGGLVAKSGQVKGFELAGADHVFHAATGVIKDDRLELGAAEVAEPMEVRFGWAKVPETDLFNQAGLPASPFKAVKD